MNFDHFNKEGVNVTLKKADLIDLCHIIEVAMKHPPEDKDSDVNMNQYHQFFYNLIPKL